MGFFNNFGGTSAADKTKLDSLSAPIKNNLIATSIPNITNDSGSGYSAGSTWIYGGITYTCTDATSGCATWANSADVFYFDSWANLVATISVVGSTYVNKYAIVSNTNGGVNSGVTYVSSSGAVTNPIVDGSSATYKINAQGTIYGVTCQVRTVTNPIITSIMIVATTKPIIAGYYIFSVVPTNGLPSGIGLNDITFFDGINWSLYQKYSSAIPVLVAGTTTNTQVTWKKQGGSWVNSYTADNASSGWYDVGSVRTQFGQGGGGSSSPTITFPAPFKDTTFSFNAMFNNGSTANTYNVMQTGKTVQSVSLNKKFQGGGATGEGLDWIAIGLKP